jgi:drug/metabolite transporter (DMT)-like permease
MPSKSSPPRVHVKPIGFLFGLVAAAGQGIGALVSRKGVTVASVAGEHVANVTFGLNATYHRILGGLAFTSLWFLTLYFLRRSRGESVAAPPIGSKGAAWIAANALIGPVAGVGCYQWALATTPSGLVLPIAATTPLLAIPITYWLEGDRPSKRSVFGGAVAVVGCIALTITR